MSEQTLRSRYGKTALVTGASSGIGEAFAKRLAGLGFDLVLVARRLDRLNALSEKLSSAHGVSCHVVAVDLSLPSSGQTVEEFVTARGLQIDILVNNAGFGLLGTFERSEHSRLLEMVDVNCRAVVDLSKRFMPPMKSRKRGAVIIVSSVVGAVPTPWFAVYAATKSFDLYFGEAIHAECRGTGVDVVTVLPGLTDTEFQASAGTRDYHAPYRTADQVATSALNAVGRKAIVVDGWMYKLLVHGSRFFPRALLLLGARMVMVREFKPAD